MRVLVSCEFSGIVRDAFAARGHDAVSCDLLPSERPGQHYQGDVRDILGDGWDLMVAHPPCTYLCNSGVRWLSTEVGRWEKMLQAAAFFRLFMNTSIPCVAIENPVMHGYAKAIIGREQTQVIQPYQHGHTEQKATCLWLHNLPQLRATHDVYAEMMRLPRREREKTHYASPSPARWAERSLTYQGIADALADQWGSADALMSDLPLFAQAQP